MFEGEHWQRRCIFCKCTGDDDDSAWCSGACRRLTRAAATPRTWATSFLFEYFAAFAAMELFDVVTAAAQMMLVRPCTFDADACARGYNESMRGLSLHPARTLDSYAAATCFRRVIMGYSMALGPRLLLHLHTALRPQIQAFFAGNLGLGWVYEEALQQHSILIVRKGPAMAPVMFGPTFAIIHAHLKLYSPPSRCRASTACRCSQCAVNCRHLPPPA